MFELNVSWRLRLSVRAVYDELHDTVAAIDEQEDLRWWRNTHGPGMPTDWPHFQVTEPPLQNGRGLSATALNSCFLNVLVF